MLVLLATIANKPSSGDHAIPVQIFACVDCAVHTIPSEDVIKTPVVITDVTTNNRNLGDHPISYQ